MSKYWNNLPVIGNISVIKSRKKDQNLFLNKEKGKSWAFLPRFLPTFDSIYAETWLSKIGKTENQFAFSWFFKIRYINWWFYGNNSICKTTFWDIIHNIISFPCEFCNQKQNVLKQNDCLLIFCMKGLKGLMCHKSAKIVDKQVSANVCLIRVTTVPHHIVSTLYKLHNFHTICVSSSFSKTWLKIFACMKF